MEYWLVLSFASLHLDPAWVAGNRFELTSTVETDAVVWWAVGELDLANEKSLVDSVTGSFETAGGAVVLDLSQLTFIDASGLRAVVQCHRAALAHHVTFSLRGAVANVAALLEMTGVAPAIEAKTSAHANRS